MTDRFYVTTAIPYVNGAPHVGHALEVVQADALARYARLRGRDVRFLTGTDDNALKNVQSADTAGVDVASFVATNAQRFHDLRQPLALSNDDFIRTSIDPRHRPAVEWFWDACRRRGDLYERRYEGWYCAGCEQFYDADDLLQGRCPEHGNTVERVAEQNWFFRLSRYQETIATAIESGELQIEPEHRRNEVLAFVRSGLRDFSVSRPRERARGWGIPVPGDPSQVIYVWFDALVNYVSALRAPDGGEYTRWWCNDGERVHVIGKGILRFHAVYWPAILRSAGQPWPTTIFVHDYLTVDGNKIGKSAGNAAAALDPFDVSARYGDDALRWWLLREVPRNGDADFTIERLIATANRDLANGFGNFVQRVRGLARSSEPVTNDRLTTAAEAPDAIDVALSRFDFRAALDALLAIVTEGNRYIETTRPWKAGERRGDVVAPLVDAIRVLESELQPFTPSLAARIAEGAAPNPAFARLRSLTGNSPVN
jgi:methionyl-tRNA synthetase